MTSSGPPTDGAFTNLVVEQNAGIHKLIVDQIWQTEGAAPIADPVDPASTQAAVIAILELLRANGMLERNVATQQ